jgi:hypothetical protein
MSLKLRGECKIETDKRALEGIFEPKGGGIIRRLENLA